MIIFSVRISGYRDSPVLRTSIINHKGCACKYDTLTKKSVICYQTDVKYIQKTRRLRGSEIGGVNFSSFNQKFINRLIVTSFRFASPNTSLYAPVVHIMCRRHISPRLKARIFAIRRTTRRMTQYTASGMHERNAFYITHHRCISLCRRQTIPFPHLPQQTSSRRDFIQFIGLHPTSSDFIARHRLAPS